ncbi:aminopeptidase P family protein [Corynebacterium uropygiale]|uniref:Aminopeptidase P family protein n=1 Tax=Corynebacterium uropygiale TaxID=1775911 RepID=A0A9X1U0J7_9CORY|nr:aminopeptidase P family protein [Corynebacterium uropygiale]MCF4006558.1 aminopeptidase P family protein [Corynebacterium uropygiale]
MALADTRYADRRRKLAAEIAGRRIDTLLVTNLIHVGYLSGFRGSNAALLVSTDLSARICTDGRYTTQIAEEAPDIPALIARPSAEALLREVTGPRRIGFEADAVSVSQLESFREACAEDVELVPVTGLVEALREVKDPQELEDLRSIASLATQALADLLEAGELAVGRTEREVAADLEYRMRRLGSERTSFDTIVASGPNSAKPHHGASDRVIARGDIVTIDYGAYREGANSDATRSFIMGEASDFSREIYEVVLEAQLAGIAAARPGARLVDVDAACRRVIADAGYGEYFVHSTGHGVGLEVHEAPFASQSGVGELREGMTLTIEPGIYVPGKGGVRIEDTLIITRGDAEIITGVSKDLTVV